MMQYNILCSVKRFEAYETIGGLFAEVMRISLKWYRCSGRMVPCGAEAWYRSYRSDGTGTKSPICTLSKGAVRKVPQGTLR